MECSRIRRARAAGGISLVELGIEAQLHYSALSLAENGKLRLSADTAERVRAALRRLLARRVINATQELVELG